MTISPVVPSGTRLQRGVDDARLAARGAPDRAELAPCRIERVRERRRGRLGEAHRLDDADAELLLEGAQVLGRQRRRGRAAEAEPRRSASRGGTAPSSRYEIMVGTTLIHVQPDRAACAQKRAAENAAASPGCRRGRAAPASSP